MKIEVKKKENKNSYPCLKQSDYGRIVLFTSPMTGTLLKDVDVSCQKYSPLEREYHTANDWKEDDFTPFNGTITLSND